MSEELPCRWCHRIAMASSLPDELWRRIMELGVTHCNLTFKDLCCLSISSRRLRSLSGESSLWSRLLSTGFPNHSSNPSQSPSSSSPKTIYKIRYEKDRARKLAAHRRAVLRVESRIAEHSRRIQDLVAKKTDEKIKINDAFLQLSNLHKVRQASIAMNVWQPEIIRSRQKDMVEQCSVPVDSRINALEMEVKLCKQQMTILDKAYRDEKHRLAAAKEQLASLQYHPLRDISETSSLAGIHDSRNKKKKLKRCCSDAS
ncbi:hypothetical protein V2J09_020622 [Rumex salicifolius]